MPPVPLRTAFYATALITLIGYLLIIGKALIVPILLALISVYILSAADRALARVPLLASLPSVLRRFILLVGFLCLFAALTWLIVSTVQDLIAKAPTYQANFERMADQVARALGFQTVPDWAAIQRTMSGQIDLRSAISVLAGQLGSLGGALFLTIIYAIFLVAERTQFNQKLKLAVPDREEAGHTLELIGQINQRIGEYLGAKTLVNVIIGLGSWAALALFGVDYAPFWALLIGLLNYVPYVGAIIAVSLPVIFSLVQFAAPLSTLGLLACLEAIQIAVGNFLEPRMVGQRVNLSPFVVLVSLSLWSSMWGVVGAFMAVPLTSVVVIILNEIPATRGLAVMMSNKVPLGQDPS